MYIFIGNNLSLSRLHLRGVVVLTLTLLLTLGTTLDSVWASTATPATALTVPKLEPTTNGNKLDQATALRISQAVIGTTPTDYTFLDRQERPVRLSSYRGKPLLVSFIYTGCFQVCPGNTRSLHEAVQTLQKIVGPNQFNVVSIGFNQPFDSPSALRAFSAQHSINADNWEFLSPHTSIVEPLTRELGFSYVSDPSGIDHILEVTILDAQGRIYTQVYGDRLTPDQLGEPLRQLLRGAPIPQTLSLVDVVDRIRILCTVYDPTTGKYRYDYGLILEIAGGCTFFLTMIWFFINEWLTRRRLQRAATTKAIASVIPSS